MRTFELHEPKSVTEAVALLDKFGPAARPVGGGTDLVTGIMKDWVEGKGMPYPEKLVDVTTIPTLAGIKATDSGVTIGAATILTDILESDEVKKGWPVLWHAIDSIASTMTRNMATLGGNVNQRPRCWFFRGDFNCYKKGGDFCFAVTGDNRFHAIIGGELCYIVHPSDTATALLALNAKARIAGPGGERVVPFDSYFHGPREDVLTENHLKPSELLVGVEIPRLAPGTGTAWHKLKDRLTYDFAVVSVAAVVTHQNGVWKDGRIVLGGVAPVPWRATVVEEALAGKSIKDAIKDAAARIRSVARPLSNNAHKVDIAVELTQRVVLSALA